MFVPRIPQTLTVGGQHYESGAKNPMPGRHVPMLRLCGIWMEQLDFRTGDKVAVQVEQGTITLRVLTEARPKQDKRTRK